MFFFNSHDNGEASSVDLDHCLAKDNSLAYKMRTLLAQSPCSHVCSQVSLKVTQPRVDVEDWVPCCSAVR